MYLLKLNQSELLLDPNAGGQWKHLFLTSPVDGSSISLLSGYLSDEPFFATGSFLMFPWTNRLDPNPWAIPPFFPNEAWITDANGLPLHGLLHSCKRKKLREFRGEESSSVEFSLEMPETWNATPLGKIEAIESYTLSDHRLEINYQLRNLGEEDFPFALGIHPYFSWNGAESIDDCYLFGSGFHQVRLGDYQLPAEILEEDIVLKHEQCLAGLSLDNLYACLPNQDSFVGLFSINREESLMIRGGRYYQVYTPNNRKSIAIEPMTSPGNFLHTKHGETNILSSGGKKRISFQISLESFRK